MKSSRHQQQIAPGRNLQPAHPAPHQWFLIRVAIQANQSPAYRPSPVATA